MLRQLASSTHTRAIKTGTHVKTLEHSDLNGGSAPSLQTTYARLQLHHSVSKEIYCKYARKSKDKAEPSAKDYISVSNCVTYCTVSVSDRNPLWTHSNQTSRHFFFQNNRPAMFSASQSHLPPPQVSLCCV